MVLTARLRLWAVRLVAKQYNPSSCHTLPLEVYRNEWSCSTMLPLALVALLTASSVSLAVEDTDCKWRQNITDIGQLPKGRHEVLENCLYYYLSDQANRASGDVYALFLEAPVSSSQQLPLTINNVVVDQVHSPSDSFSQFTVIGDIYVSWMDQRLKWETKEWHITSFKMHDFHHIWTPELTEQDSCSSVLSCWAHMHDIELSFSGLVKARINYRLTSTCAVDFTHYPEDVNDCCMLLQAADEYESQLRFDVENSNGHVGPGQPVTVGMVRDTLGLNTKPSTALSDWVVKTVSTSVYTRDDDGAQALEVCLKAHRQSPTLKMALTMPVSIITIIMLVSPLFGDLKIQALVKLFTLGLQTICFLFLCSQAPNTGFGTTKPKIYTFYETMFVLSLLSVLVTVLALALCRVRRKVPPPHRLYLVAKLVNTNLCCIQDDGNDIDRSSSYHQYTNNSENPIAQTPADYSPEWKHIFVACNNLFSGICLTVFVFTALFNAL
uniref:Neurotransmitter-gated ion-channel ligand-binding domain-containing protein n=1 Tax=Plectus sambesii TaxID=2011161 RepID=A0A914VCQ9_9BILA